MAGRSRLPHYNVRYTLSAAETGQNVPWGVTYLGVEKLHTKGIRGKGISVAVLDSGIDSDHPDFKGAIVAVKDFSGSASGTMDKCGHGTHTAGTIASRDNGQGIIGIAPECSLVIGKVLDDDGSGDNDGIAAGVRWAVDCGSQIISLSLGCPEPDDAMRKALEYAVSKGVLIFSAAGNEGAAGVGYPAKWNALTEAIAANDQQGRIASFSSVGDAVDVCAPGVQILSCWPGNRYSRLDGTSMSTPHCAGVMALVQGYRKDRGLPLIKNQQELCAAVRLTSKSIAPVPSPKYGYGLINASGLLTHGLPVAPSPIPVPGQSPKQISVQVGKLPTGYSWNLVGTPIQTEGA